MIIKHGGHILVEIHEVYIYIYGLFFLGADWLGKQTPSTWIGYCVDFSIITYW